MWKMQMEENILATVGDRVITRDMMLSVMRGMPAEELEFVSGEAGRKLLLDEMIAGELLLADAEARRWEQEQDFIRLLAEAKKGLLQRYAVGKLFDTIQVSDQEIKAYYDAHAAEFKQEEKMSAKHILVDSLAAAEKIKAEIEAGKAFEDAAVEYSSCPSKARGGDLGTFSRGKMVKEFEDAAFALTEGMVSQPVKTQFGYHLIKAGEITPAGPADWETVKDKIKKLLFQAKQKEVYAKKLEELKQSYPVKINLTALK